MKINFNAATTNNGTNKILIGENIYGGVKMTEIEDLLKDIEVLRKQMEYLITEKHGNLIDAEVVAASKILNAALNKYNKFIEEKIKKL